MTTSPLILYALYKEHKDKSICLDIETCEYDGNIAVIGLYKPKEGSVDDNTIQLIKGKNLNEQELKNALKDVKLIITYNGLNHDIPKIIKEFPDAIPEDCKYLDLYVMAKNLNFQAGLKVLESTFSIERMDGYDKKRDRPIYLWKRYFYRNDQETLKTLLEYNKQDCVNLYMLAEELSKKIIEQLNSLKI